MSFTTRLLVVAFAAALVAAPPRAGAGVGRAGAEAVELVSKQFRRTLGREVVEFGGERATRELAERLVREGGEGTAARLGRIATAGEPSTIRALRTVPGRALRHLDDVPDGELVRAVGTLARPGVAEGFTSLGSDALRSAALRAEMRLPGAGAGLVREFGDDGLRAAGRLSDNQANQLLKVDRVAAVRRLSPEGRRALLDAVASNPAAQVQVIRTAGRVTAGGIAVVAGGAVLWHASDVALAPSERVVTHPDGTIERTTTSVGGQAAAALPDVAGKLAPSMTAFGYAAAAALGVVGCTAVVLRHRRRPARRA